MTDFWNLPAEGRIKYYASTVKADYIFLCVGGPALPLPQEPPRFDKIIEWPTEGHHG